MKISIRILVIASVLATLLLIWLTSTQSGFNWAYQRVESYLPQQLSIQTMTGRLIGPIYVEGLEYKQDKNTVRANQVSLDWRPSGLLRGHIDIQRLYVETLQIDLGPSESDSSTTPITLPSIRLPWRLTMQDAQITDIRLKQGEKTFAINHTKLNATAKLSRVSIEELSIEADNFKLIIDGTVRPINHYEHNLSIQWQANFPSGTTTQGYGQLVGDVEATRITQNVDGPLKASLNASLHHLLLDKLSWQASATISDFDLSQWNAEWPALTGSLKLDSQGDLENAALSGTMEGDYPDAGPLDADFNLQRLPDNTIKIDHLNIHVSHSETQLNSYGYWQPGASGGDIELNLNWKNLRWPTQSPAWFDSAYGDALITGNVDHYKIRLTTDTPRPELPPSSWSLLAEGNLDGLTVNALQINALGGEAITTGELNWTPNLSWKAQISANNIDPSRAWPQWPGNLNARINSSGQIIKDQLIAHAEVKKLSGQLRDYPVSLSSKLSLRDNDIHISHLNFTSGTTQASAQGKIGPTSKLKWHINAADIGTLYPQARGKFNAEGLLTGSQEKPLITTTIKGENLSLADYKIGLIKGQLAVDLFRWQKTNIELTTQDLLLKGQAVQTLSINGGVNKLIVEAGSDLGSFQLDVEGETTATGWQGRITRADIQSKQLTNWQLRAPTALHFDNTTLALNALCWESAQDASICTSLQRDDRNWQSKLTITQLPLSLLNTWGPEGLKVKGVLNASAKLRFQDASLLGKASVALPQGVVYFPLLDSERDHWSYRGGKVNILLSEKGLTTDANFAMSNGDMLQFNAELPGAQLLALDPRHQTLRANAQLNAHDLGLIETLVPELQDLRGHLALDINATGTLAKPIIIGDAKLVEGSLRIPRLGLTVDQLSLRSQNDASNDILFQLKAHSGGGNLVVDGKTQLDGSKGWPTHLHVTGKEFEVARIPEAQVLVSPDVKVKVQNRNVTITGDVHIPYARLQPKDITTAAHVSDDVIILDDELTPTEEWAVTSSIRLTLGNRVNFYGFGFEGRFGGNLLLKDEPGQSTRATGEINIPEGRYRAYGQRLDIEEGSFIFSGGPLSNPGLDVRAVRDINEVTVGVKLRGNLNKPQVELFSNPAMGETDTLSYLILGRPMEGASSEDGNMVAQAALALSLSGGDRIARALGNRFGMDEMRVASNDTGDQASLVLGRYLSPKLYVGYGVGILKATNTFSLRYQISKHWLLKGESGETSGMDILYTIDR